MAPSSVSVAYGQVIEYIQGMCGKHLIHDPLLRFTAPAPRKLDTTDRQVYRSTLSSVLHTSAQREHPLSISDRTEEIASEKVLESTTRPNPSLCATWPASVFHN